MIFVITASSGRYHSSCTQWTGLTPLLRSFPWQFPCHLSFCYMHRSWERVWCYIGAIGDVPLSEPRHRSTYSINLVQPGWLRCRYRYISGILDGTRVFQIRNNKIMRRVTIFRTLKLFHNVSKNTSNNSLKQQKRTCMFLNFGLIMYLPDSFGFLSHRGNLKTA